MAWEEVSLIRIEAAEKRDAVLRCGQPFKGVCSKVILFPVVSIEIGTWLPDSNQVKLAGKFWGNVSSLTRVKI